MLDFVEKLNEEDTIKKIYYNDYSFSEKLPNTEEYKRVVRKLKKKEEKFLQKENEFFCKDFREYLEIRNIKEDLEAENQFELGFKLAIKIILDAIKKNK